MAQVAYLRRVQKKRERASIEFVEQYSHSSIPNAIQAVCEGRAYIIEKDHMVIACATLPSVDSDLVGPGLAIIAPPIIDPEFEYFGLACLLVPLPVVYAHLYLPELGALHIQNAPHNIEKALLNLGFSQDAANNWLLPTRRANRSAIELMNICGVQIATVQGSRGTLRIINRDPGPLLSFENRNALQSVARIPQEESVGLGVRQQPIGSKGNCQG